MTVFALKPAPLRAGISHVIWALSFACAVVGWSAEALSQFYPAKPVPVPHPVVRTHDEPGAKALYVHETMTDYIADMYPAASEALLRRRYAATADYQEDENRLLYRTMING